MRQTCPACQSKGPHTEVFYDYRYPSSPLLGPGLALLLVAARKPRFRCGECGVIFAGSSFSSCLCISVLVLTLALFAIILLTILVH